VVAAASWPCTTTTTCCHHTSSTRSSERFTTLTDPDPSSIPAVDGICDECGFDYDGFPDDATVVDGLGALGRRYTMPMTRGLPGEDLDALVRAHPTDGVWSALEYACHVRDVLATQRARVAQTVAEDSPTYTPMGREERLVSDRYNEQDRAVVAGEIAANATAMADAFASLTDDQWERAGVYNYPTPTERDLRWLARHTLHEGSHHLLDIGRVMRAARGR
jgi:hypothetical protein